MLWLKIPPKTLPKGQSDISLCLCAYRTISLGLYRILIRERIRSRSHKKFAGSTALICRTAFIREVLTEPYGYGANLTTARPIRSHTHIFQFRLRLWPRLRAKHRFFSITSNSRSNPASAPRAAPIFSITSNSRPNPAPRAVPIFRYHVQFQMESGSGSAPSTYFQYREQFQIESGFGSARSTDFQYSL